MPNQKGFPRIRDKFSKWVRSDEILYYWYYELAFWTGCRPSELIALKESDFDLSLTGFDSVLLENLLNSIDVKDKSAPKEFDEVGSDIEMDYCCPACGYEWSGKAK